ncbi:phosphoadenosine phosphosulfate reductase family protein [Massilia luteola]|uniref:phosphoadenosine phosphosulfate reductase family protein n=1 Tax=Massilia luteola TaxID=3081751 RepID=UPI002ACC14CD|nr:phosphoadenosine phosphosulfate reductase family protein [Massilia sp. Gc5]
MMRDPFYFDGEGAISFSGGRTSGYMLWRVLQAHGGTLPDHVRVFFANTGKEAEETLEFVRDCGRHWNVPILWVEFRDDETGYAVVDFETASRDGEPFAALIRKRRYLPNPVTRFCTTELKIRAMHRHIRTLGWGRWDQMIGIRADEQRRVAKIRARGRSTETSKETMLMPLADVGVTKHDVMAFWNSQPFDLGLKNVNGVTPGGNCDLCFLKGPRQVFSMIRQRPGLAVWWAKQEQWASENIDGPSKGDGWRFRNDRPGYQRMHDYALAQGNLFEDAEDDAIPCFCGD